MATEMVRLTEQQLSFLINASYREHVVSLKFGPGWVGLESIPSNEWARQALETEQP